MELIRLEELEPWKVGDFRALISRLGGVEVARQINADQLVVRLVQPTIVDTTQLEQTIVPGEVVLEERSKPSAPQLVPLPENGVEFELTLDSAMQGLALVTAFGYSGNWKFNGKPVTEPFTRRFKLESVGYCANLDEVTRKCGKKGRVPEGPWLQAFRLAYPNNDGQGPIGIADPSWVDPGGDVSFPVLDQGGFGWGPDFHWASSDRDGLWLLLIEVQR